uniref:N-acetyllactosaminide beta-1,3-N-acetylglucosaminyltransferase n=1 Tax=Strongyloides venezuelensis TaxID=75913 RepID=A0A0K0EZ02_STRVS
MKDHGMFNYNSHIFINNFSLTFTKYKNYKIIPNIIKSTNYSYDNSIILILHISSDQILEKLKNHLLNWEGYISLAVYLDSYTFFSFETICTYCRLKEIIGISNKLSVHFVYNDIFNSTIDDYLLSHTIGNICNKYPVTYLNQSCTNVLTNEEERGTKMSKYPANILRNIARKYCYGKYILIADIDHMFSRNFHDKMLNVAKNKLNNKNDTKYALVYRIFEVKTKNLSEAPKNKLELKELMSKKEAFVFHHYYKNAHSIPKLDEWLSIPDQEVPDIQFKAKYDRSYWEPQFISLNDIPYHDETFPYPNRDNTVLRWEMCRNGYQFLIVNDVFMFHLGLKEINESKAVSIARSLTNSQKENSKSKFRKVMDSKYPLTAKECPL